MKIQKSKIKMQNHSSKIKSRRTFNFILVLLTFAFCLLPSKTYAQQSSLTVSPPLIEIEAIPPTSLETPISVKNNSDEEIELQVLLKPFIQSAKENGEVQFLKDTDAFPGANKKIAEHIEIRENSRKITSLTLLPKEKKELDLYVGIDKDEPHSDYYFAVVFLPPAITSKSNEEDDNGSNIRGGIGINVLLSVGPRNDAKGLIEAFSAPSFLQSGPVPFNVRIKNTGSHYITPTGSVLIENLFGQKIGRITLHQANILTGSSRAFVSDESFKEQLKAQQTAEKKGTAPIVPNTTVTNPVVIWPEKFLVGPYTATLRVSLSPKGPEMTRQLRFFAFPGQLLIALVIGIVILIVVKKRVDSRRNS
jgi:hypothetical protein